MKNNRIIFGRTFFLTAPILILLFAAVLIPVGTTLGKYSKGYEYEVELTDFEIPLNIYCSNPTNPGGGPEIFDETPTTIYQVQQGDTLATIEEKFGTTVEALIAYNNLEALYEIEVGMILRIPPADYVVPEMGTGEPLPSELPSEPTPNEPEPQESESGAPADETLTPPEAEIWEGNA